MWQNSKMSDYWYLVAVIDSLTLGVQIVAGLYLGNSLLQSARMPLGDKWHNASRGSPSLGCFWSRSRFRFCNCWRLRASAFCSA
jgi:hypothetical protein